MSREKAMVSPARAAVRPVVPLAAPRPPAPALGPSSLLSDIKGIGPANAALLDKLGLRTTAVQRHWASREHPCDQGPEPSAGMSTILIPLEPAQVDLEPSLPVVAHEPRGPRTSAAVSPSRPSSEIEISPLRGAQERTEASSTSPSGSRAASATRGKFLVTTPSLGFVRFQIRTAQRPRVGPLTTLVATVVKSIRINGRPRLKLVAYIGSIRVDDIQRLSRWKFWSGADARLAEFSPETRGRFERAVEARIPRLTDAEAAIVAAAQARMEAKRAARARMAGTRAERAGQGRVEPPTTPARRTA